MGTNNSTSIDDSSSTGTSQPTEKKNAVPNSTTQPSPRGNSTVSTVTFDLESFSKKSSDPVPKVNKAISGGPVVSSDRDANKKLRIKLNYLKVRNENAQKDNKRLKKEYDDYKKKSEEYIINLKKRHEADMKKLKNSARVEL